MVVGSSSRCLSSVGWNKICIPIKQIASFIKQVVKGQGTTHHRSAVPLPILSKIKQG